MQSMTGYGRCLVKADGREMTVEVKSVNHRFLDVSFRLSRAIAFLDDAVRAGVGERLARGHVDVFVNYVNNRQDARTVKVDASLALAYKQAMQELGEALRMPSAVTLQEYARMPDVFCVMEKEEDQDAVRTLLCRALSGALDQLWVMREREGERMREDVLKKTQRLEEIRDEIALRAPLVVSEYRDKLHERLKALLDGELDETRFATEVAIFADRAAIDEELVRLQSHIRQIRDACTLSEPVGRKLDFLVQELNREVNTIGSKAGDAQIAQLVVAAKAEIEKLREQVQNIE